MVRSMVKVSLFALLVIIFGCASNGINLVSSGAVKVEVVPTEDETIVGSDVFQDESGLFISGRVHTGGYEPLEKGHVDVEILNPDGTPIKQCVHYFHLVTRKLDKTAPFYAHLRPVNLPQGAIIRLTYHHHTAHEELLNPCGG